MPTKSTKNTATKKTAKKVSVKKNVKSAAAKEKIQTAPVPEMTQCSCGGKCNCGPNCKCGHSTSKCARFVVKLLIVLIIFALGFAAAKFVDGNRYFRGPRVEFTNGCLDVASVKCPQMQSVLPMMDIDRDGCITREEYRAIKKELGRQIRSGSNIRRGIRH